MPRLLRLSRADEHELPFAKQTFYRWHHLHRYPELFVKMGRTLFVDMDELDRILDRGRQKYKATLAKRQNEKLSAPGASTEEGGNRCHIQERNRIVERTR